MENEQLLSSHNVLNAIIVIVLTAALFMLDVFTPVGTATGILYVLPLLFALKIRNKSVFIAAPVVFSIIALVALFLKPDRAPTWIPTINRTFTIIVLGIVSFADYRRSRSDEALRESERRDITALKRTEQQLSVSVKEAEKRASEAEERRRILEAIMVNIPEGLTVSEAPEGAILLASRMYANITGIPFEKLTGMTLDERFIATTFLSRDTLEPVAKEDLPVFLALYKGETTLDRELLVRRRDGSSITVLSNAAPVRDASGKITHAVVSWRDITDRKKTEETLRRNEYELRTLMENTPDLLFRLDKLLRYLFVNTAYERMTGIAHDTFIGKTNSDLGMLPEHKALWEPAIRKVLETGRELFVEFNVPGFMGKRLFRVRIIPEFAKSGHVESVIVIARDITEPAYSVPSFKND